MNKNKEKTILILSLSGIGEVIMHVPMIRELKKNNPSVKIILALMWPQAIKLIEGLGIVDEFIVVNYKAQDTILKKIKLLSYLRKKKIDFCINTFPNNSIQKNIFSFLSKAKVRISHDYNFAPFYKFNFLNNFFIPLDLKAHDVKQNMNLLKAFNVDLENIDHRLELYVSADAKNKAINILDSHADRHGHRYIGVHIGTSTNFNMGFKRWPLKKWADFVDKIVNENDNLYFLFFCSRQEERFVDEVIGFSKNKNKIFKIIDDLEAVAALIQKCLLMIGNDSVMIHISAALDIPSIGLFGPTDPIRTKPFLEKSYLVKSDSDCAPCYRIENVGKAIKCKFKINKCMDKIQVEDVCAVVKRIID